MKKSCVCQSGGYIFTAYYLHILRACKWKIMYNDDRQPWKRYKMVSVNTQMSVFTFATNVQDVDIFLPDVSKIPMVS